MKIMKTKKLLSLILISAFLASMIFVTSTTATSVSGLVGRWHFDEGSGQTILDSAGSNHGKLGSTTGVDTNDPSWGSGLYGGALSFDGINDIASIPFDSSGISDVSIEYWVKPAETRWDDWVVSFGMYAPEFGWTYENNGYLAPPRLCLYFAGLGYFTFDDLVPTAGVWNNIVYTRDDGLWNAYLNGIKSAKTFNVPNTFQNNIMISAQGPPYPGEYSGKIDELRMWNKALSDEEVKKHSWGLVGEWDFDEASGSTAYDSSGFGNDGTIVGATYDSNGRFNSALHFDGDGDYVTIPDNPSLDATGEITLEAWIKVDNFITMGSNPVHLYVVSKDNEAARSYGIAVNLNFPGYPANTPGFVVFTDKARIVFADSPIEMDIWYHIAGTYKASTGELKIYVNGEDTSTSVTTASIFSGSSNLRIGAREFTGFYNYFNGWIDEVRIWNQALVPAKFTQTGLDNTATGTVATVADPILLDYDNLPHVVMVKAGSTINYDFEEIVASNTAGKRFVLSDVTPDEPFTSVTAPTTIMGTYTVQNAPIAEAGGPYVGTEGTAISFDASGSADPDGDALQYRWDFSNDGTLDTAWSADPGASTTWFDDFSGTAKVWVTDGVLTSSDTSTVTINNVAPMISSLTAPTIPVAIGATITATAAFSDPGTGDTHFASINWGDSITEPFDPITSPIIKTHIYTIPNIYEISLTVVDDDGGSDTEIFQYVVVYDPNGGFVTGGGWINSPAGAYIEDTSLTGKATFGFVSKYQKGATIPTGNTEFQFHVAGMKFKSTSYQWLVVAGSTAQFKGTGTINGLGNFKFQLFADDGGTLNPDTFRIKIWDAITEDTFYDNGVKQTILGGSIVIHK